MYKLTGLARLCFTSSISDGEELKQILEYDTNIPVF